jgi:hypothetical protein
MPFATRHLGWPTLTIWSSRPATKSIWTVSWSGFWSCCCAYRTFGVSRRPTDLFGKMTTPAWFEALLAALIRWSKDDGYRPEDIRGLAVDEHVARLRDRFRRPPSNMRARPVGSGARPVTVGRRRRTPSAVLLDNFSTPSPGSRVPAGGVPWNEGPGGMAGTTIPG